MHDKITGVLYNNDVSVLESTFKVADGTITDGCKKQLLFVFRSTTQIEIVGYTCGKQAHEQSTDKK